MEGEFICGDEEDKKEVLCGCRGRDPGRGVDVAALRSTGRWIGSGWVKMRRGGGARTDAEGRRRPDGCAGAAAPGRKRDGGTWMEKERRRRGTSSSRFACDAARGSLARTLVVGRSCPGEIAGVGIS